MFIRWTIRVSRWSPLYTQLKVIWIENRRIRIIRGYRISNNIQRHFWIWTRCWSMYTVLKMDRSFLCGSLMTRRRSNFLYLQNSHDRLGHFAWLRTCRVSWDRKLPGKRTRSFSAIDKYNKKSQEKEIETKKFLYLQVFSLLQFIRKIAIA